MNPTDQWSIPPIIATLTALMMLLLCATPCAAQTLDDATFLHDEAGIAAYTKALTPINLNNIAQALDTATIGPDYVKGTLTDTPYALLAHDVHIYAHQDGWMIAYFPPDALVSELFMTKEELECDGDTALECALKTIAVPNDVNIWQVDYFDFRFPDATQMLWVSTYGQEVQLKIHSEEIYTQSWALVHRGNAGETAFLMWDDELLSTRDTPGWNYDVLPDVGARDGLTHTVKLTSTTHYLGWSRAEFAFIYGPQWDDCYTCPQFSVAASNFIHRVLRYPRELINDTTPPTIINAVTNTHTHSNGYELNFEFDEWVLYSIRITAYFPDRPPLIKDTRNMQYATIGSVAVFCQDCTHASFRISAYDMSGNYFQDVYTIEHALHLKRRAYLPILNRN